jgi:chemotaxis signal transduction protein
MNSNAETEGMNRKTLDVVLFRLGPFLLGAPAAQVECIRHGELPQTASNGDLLDLRDIFSAPSGEATGFPPVFLEVVGGPGRRRIRVDAAEGIITLHLTQIKRLPPLIDAHKSHASLWGLAVLDETIAFLLDLDQLKRGDP